LKKFFEELKVELNRIVNKAILIANSTANSAENIVFVRTFWPSTGAIVNVKDLHR